jgi:hypothetical protein
MLSYTDYLKLTEPNLWMIFYYVPYFDMVNLFQSRVYIYNELRKIQFTGRSTYILSLSKKWME